MNCQRTLMAYSLQQPTAIVLRVVTLDRRKCSLISVHNYCSRPVNAASSSLQQHTHNLPRLGKWLTIVNETCQLMPEISTWGQGLTADWLDIICIMSHELPCTSAYQTSVGNQSLGFKAAHCTSAYVYCQTPSVIIATIHRNSSSFQWVDFTISCYKWFNYSELCFDQSTKYTVTGHKTKCSGRHMSARLSNVKNDMTSYRPKQEKKLILSHTTRQTKTRRHSVPYNMQST